MSNPSKNSKVNVPEAKDALNNMKYEVARELGVTMKQGYNGDLTSRENGYVGGYMVKKMIEDYGAPDVRQRASNARRSLKSNCNNE